ncbi:MAG: ABC transporter permease [Sedimentisphaerales bacterium]|nr:ABC transporter permease [Sedimentisphaerales bacterium]
MNITENNKNKSYNYTPGYGLLTRSADMFVMLGGITRLLGHACSIVAKSVTAGGAKISFGSLLSQMVRVGVKAIPIVILIQIAIGVIMHLQMYPKLSEFGQGDQIATINAIAALRELGPLMTAIILSGFAGASIAAELGTMVTSEEIEALRATALDPIRFLVIPRLLATTIMTILLAVIADVVMVAAGMLTGIKLGIDPGIYFQLSKEAVDIAGFVSGLIKAGIYGMLIGLIACYMGLNVKPWQGSQGVGQATTLTVVYSVVAVIVAAAIFTIIFFAYGVLG